MENLQKASQDNLRRLVEQIERLDEERKALAADIADKFTEAKGLGFDAKILRKVLALRKKSQVEREEEEQMIAAYLGALEGTPLGDFAKKKGARKMGFVPAVKEAAE
jgi:uncharacterized protein (UPF0335 family)